jgi:predicted DCC family thiol-disulfide oxidoreductase YuxK
MMPGCYGCRYDGVCNLCNGGVNFMLDWDRPSQLKGEFRFAALQSEVGRALLRRGGRAENDISSIVLATAGALYGSLHACHVQRNGYDYAMVLQYASQC